MEALTVIGFIVIMVGIVVQATAIAMAILEGLSYRRNNKVIAYEDELVEMVLEYIKLRDEEEK